MNKFLSRKFLLCLAAFLGSIGTSIAGLHTGNQTVACIGIVCSIVSAAIYAAMEALVDASHAQISGPPTVFIGLDDEEDEDDVELEDPTDH